MPTACMPLMLSGVCFVFAACQLHHAGSNHGAERAPLFSAGTTTQPQTPTSTLARMRLRPASCAFPSQLPLLSATNWRPCFYPGSLSLASLYTCCFKHFATMITH